MEQTKALNALAPFVALTKSASSPRAAADLIARATSAPNTYIFSELLSSPQILALEDAPEYASHLTLLKIFSYGTYTDYHSTSSLPSLSSAQTTKLRQLSLLTLARTPAKLSYENLLVSLGLSTQRELEDLVISAIYAGLLDAALDPYHKRIAVSSIAPLRDLEPNSIPEMLSTLQEWSTRCTSTLSELEKQIKAVRESAMKRKREEMEWDEKVERMIEKGAGVDVEGGGEKRDGNGKGKGKESEGTGYGGGFFKGAGRTLGLGAGAANKRAAQNEVEVSDEEDMDLDEADEEVESTGRRESRSSKKRGLGRS